MNSSQTPWIKVSSKIAQYEYDIYNLLGKGQFGSVYPARMIGDPRSLCIKIIKLEGLDPKKIQTLEREIAISLNIKNLKNQNLVETLDAFVAQVNNTKCVCIIMEKLTYGDLDSFLFDRQLEESDAISIIGQCVNGYLGLISFKILHRDIKPQNILLTEQNGRIIVKLGDFGVSRLIDQHVDKSKLTRVGSGLYMCPQIVLNKPYTNKCDVFSLGVVFHNILFKKFNQDLKNMVQLLDFMNNLQVQSHDCRINQCEPKGQKPISQETMDLLSQMLTFEEEKRIDWSGLAYHSLLTSFISHQKSQTEFLKFTQYKISPTQINLDSVIASQIIQPIEEQPQQKQEVLQKQDTKQHQQIPHQMENPSRIKVLKQPQQQQEANPQNQYSQGSQNQANLNNQNSYPIQTNQSYEITQHGLYLQKLFSILMNKANISDQVFKQLQILFQFNPQLYGCDSIVLYGSLLGYSLCIYYNLYYVITNQPQYLSQEMKPFIQQVNPYALQNFTSNQQLISYLQYQMQMIQGYFTQIKQQYQIQPQQENWVQLMFELQELNVKPFLDAIKYVHVQKTRNLLNQQIVTPSDPYLHLRIYYLLEYLIRIDLYYPLYNIHQIDETKIINIPRDDVLVQTLNEIYKHQI